MNGYLMTKKPVIYYDNHPSIGVNATCVDWPDRNDFFKSWSEFTGYLYSEYGDNYCLVEITASNHSELIALGVFDA